jgi:hypothetical protein
VISSIYTPGRGIGKVGENVDRPPRHLDRVCKNDHWLSPAASSTDRFANRPDKSAVARSRKAEPSMGPKLTCNPGRFRSPRGTRVASCRFWKWEVRSRGGDGGQAMGRLS